MKRWQRITLWVCLAGGAICELTALWGAYDSGGFERHHTLADLAIIGVIHLATALLWPVVLVVVVLQSIGLLPQSIMF